MTGPEVHNLTTDEVFIYDSSLTPAQAVRNAYAATISGNSYEWAQRFPLSMVREARYGSRVVYSLGDFSCVTIDREYYSVNNTTRTGPDGCFPALS
jgi:hypothetical protein